MSKFKEKWNRNSTFEKIVLIVSIICSLVVVLLSLLGIINVIPIELTNSIVLPLAGLVTLLNGINTYKRNKQLGIFSIICSAIIFACCLGIFIFRIIR